uniref:X-box-binding protein 1 n=1 Tax=Ditylenchus dipsaci TaxID=166011 RepID=A0A915DXJ4_9BILA
MPPSLSAPMGRTIYIVPHRPTHLFKSSQPSILAHRQIKLSPSNNKIPQPLYTIPRSVGTARPLQRAMPQPPLAAKKRKVELCSTPHLPPPQPATPELVDIAEVYQLLGEHFGPDQDDLIYSSNQREASQAQLKNRVAAQTARDRKKERSQKLERAVRALLQETSRLRTQNAYLQRELENIRPSSVNSSQQQPDYQLLPEVVLPEAEGSGTLQEHFQWTRGGQPAFPSAPHNPHIQQQDQYDGSTASPVHSSLRQMEDQEEAEDCELEAIFDDLFGAATRMPSTSSATKSLKMTAGRGNSSCQSHHSNGAINPMDELTITYHLFILLCSFTTASGAGYTASGLEWSSGCSSDEFSTITEGLVEGCEDAMFCTNGQEEQDYQMVDFMTEQGGFDYESNWVDGEYSVLDQEEYVHSSKHEEVVVESSSLLVEHDKNHYFSNSSSTHPLVEFDEFAVL